MSTGPEIKPLIWLIETPQTPPWSVAARHEVGGLLRRLQNGENLGMPVSRPMPSIGPRCHELRVRDAEANWRVLYRIDADAIVIAVIFSKKTQATPKAMIDLCKRRLNTYDA
jgi:phage-related protein